jgi:cytochrome c-type biogenesis protein CcmH
MGWIFVISFAILIFAGLWKSKLLKREALELVAAALLIGVVGYAWQGSPNVESAPVQNTKTQGRAS